MAASDPIMRRVQAANPDVLLVDIPCRQSRRGHARH
jgi:hypothetical protein